MASRRRKARGGCLAGTHTMALVVAGLVAIAGLAGCLRTDQDQDAGTTRPGPSKSSPDKAPAFTGAGSSFDSPLRVDLTSSGWLLVSDPKRKAIHRVSPDSLNSDRAFRIVGTPLAVGMTGDLILVGVKELQAVAVYGNTGTAMGFLAEPGTVEYPGDLSIDQATGEVFVLDGIAREVKVFSMSDRMLKMVLGTGILQAPTAVELDPVRKEVLVSDYGSASADASVKIFSYAADNPGSLLATVSAGSCNFMGCSGGFSRPRGLAVFNGKFLLVDALLGQVLVFDRNTLQRVGTLGSPDAATRDLRLPSDVAVNALGDVFVTSTLGGSVVKFQGGAL